MKAAQLLIIAALLPALAHSQAVYKYVDKDGRVHYTDRPPEDVQKTEIRVDTKADAPARRTDLREPDLRKDLSLEEKRRRMHAGLTPERCDMRWERFHAMKADLAKNPNAVVYAGGRRVTPAVLLEYEEYNKMYCDPNDPLANFPR